jgi:hypothetical protein
MNNAKLNSLEVPAVVDAGQVFEASFTMQNTGSTVWTSPRFGLGSNNPFDNANWGTGRILLPATITVKPGEQFTFRRLLSAPPVPTPFEWQMLEELNSRFGDTIPVQIVVKEGKLKLPEPRGPNDTIGGIVIISYEYRTPNTPFPKRWKNESDKAFAIEKTYLWSGAGKASPYKPGLMADIHCELRREDGTLLNMLQWDRYADIAEPTNCHWETFANPMLLLPGEKIEMLYFFNPLDYGENPDKSNWVCNHQAGIWGRYVDPPK